MAFDIRIVGNSLETEGFLGYQYAMTPLGLMTQGFINACEDIWSDSNIPITTTWTCSETPADIEVCVGD